MRIIEKPWTMKSLGEVAGFINGRAFKPEEWSNEGLPIIRIQNLTESSKLFNYYPGVIDNKYLVKKNDLLISWSASIGIYKWTGDDAVLNQHKTDTLQLLLPIILMIILKEHFFII